MKKWLKKVLEWIRNLFRKKQSNIETEETRQGKNMDYGAYSNGKTVSLTADIYSIRTSSATNINSYGGTHTIVQPISSSISSKNLNNKTMLFNYGSAAKFELYKPAKSGYGVQVGNNVISNNAIIEFNRSYKDTTVSLSTRDNMLYFNVTSGRAILSNIAINNGTLTFKVSGTINIVAINTKTKASAYGVYINGRNEMYYQPINYKAVTLSGNLIVIPSTTQSGYVATFRADKSAGDYISINLFFAMSAMGLNINSANAINIEPTYILTPSGFNPVTNTAGVYKYQTNAITI
ncbi:hypothetical protein A1D23_13420 [Chelonobacter oris]|uniref:hypothetical protein n=1 Tax=Chelonobacter oris TaxID=505317 RepID=UPI002449E636|nr:hypothetical protein [Chelonobacter oris]MDH3001633.1 hypothetical protein [Chelonobacter oris]